MSRRTRPIAAALAVLVLAALVVVWKLGWLADQPVTKPVAAQRTPGSGSAAPSTPARPGDPPAAVTPPVLDAPIGKAIAQTRELPGGAITGRVINWSTGDGIADAELTFTTTGGATTVRSTIGGAFELAPPAPATYVLATAIAPNFLPYAPEYDHSPIRANLTKDRAVDELVVFLYPAIDYRGRVLDATNQPVKGARIRSIGSHEQVLATLATEWTSDADGRFIFHAQDDTILEATQGVARGRARLDGDAQISHELVIRIGAGSPANQATSGSVVDAEGRGIANAVVRAWEAHGGGGGVAGHATTDATGRWTIEDLDAGAYAYQAEAEGFAQGSTTGAGGARDLRIELATGALISGRVVAASDQTPIPAFTILAYGKLGARRDLGAAVAIVDANGEFAVRVPTASPATEGFELIATATGWAPSAPITARPGATGVVLAMTAGATIRGTVVAAEDGSPLPFARVVRESRGGGASVQPANPGVVSRRDGTFALTGVPAGRVSITIGAGARHPKIESGLEVQDGAALDLGAIALTALAPGEKPRLELVGIGVKLAADQQGLRVDGVIEGGGAQAAGILVGDHVVVVDGAKVSDIGLDGAIAKIRGVVGTTVTVSIERAKVGTKEFVVERRKIKA